MRVALLSSGAQDYLIKPFHPSELEARAANLVRAKRTGDRLRAALDAADVARTGRARQPGQEPVPRHGVARVAHTDRNDGHERADAGPQP